MPGKQPKPSKTSGNKSIKLGSGVVALYTSSFGISKPNLKQSSVPRSVLLFVFNTSNYILYALPKGPLIITLPKERAEAPIET